MKDAEAIKCAERLAAFCNEQRSCQNCVFRLHGAENWDCQLRYFPSHFDLREADALYSAKRKNHGYIS